MAPPQRADHFETAHVRTHQEYTLAFDDRVQHLLLAMHVDLEQVEALVEQIDPIVNGRGKREEVPVDVGPAQRTVQHAGQIVARRGPAGRREQQEVGSDTVQYHAPRAPAEAQRDPGHGAQHQHVAAFRLVRPVRGGPVRRIHCPIPPRACESSRWRLSVRRSRCRSGSHYLTLHS